MFSSLNALTKQACLSEHVIFPWRFYCIIINKNLVAFYFTTFVMFPVGFAFKLHDISMCSYNIIIYSYASKLFARL